MRNYELLIIFPSEGDKTASALENVKSILSEFGAEVREEKDMGEKELPYLMKKQNRGHYFLLRIKINPDKVADVDKRFKILESAILKFTFFKED